VLIDVNAMHGRWPFAPATAGPAQASGITLALVCSAGGVLSPDPALDEADLAAEIPASSNMAHAPLISEEMPHWRQSLAEAQRAAICLVRLAPSYRRTTLDIEHLAKVIHEADTAGLCVALTVRIEDERHHHPLMPVKPPTVDQLAQLAEAIHPTSLLLLNTYLSELHALAPQSNLLFETAMLDGDEPLADAVSACGPDRLFFGSDHPILHAPAQVAKLRLAQIDNDVRDAIAHQNISRWLGPQLPTPS
jgi:hypothetical protein